MVLYTLVALITIVLAYQIRTTKDFDLTLSRQRVLNGTLLAAIFAILTALASLRLEVGNDYGTYVVTCHEIYWNGYVVTEPGYNLVVKLLYHLSGKEDYILMFAVFAALIVGVFLAALKRLSDNFFITFFLFMTLGIYFRSFNTVRYYFALAIAVYSVRFLMDINWQNITKFLVLILFAASFHKSVLAVIPMYLICRIRWNKWIIGGITLLGVIVFFINDKILELALKLYPSYRDTVYIEQNHSIMENLPILGRCILVLLLGVIFYKECVKDRADNRLYFNMNIMAIIMYLTCYWLPLVTRFGYYLITPQIILISNIVTGVEDNKKKRNLMLIIGVIGVLYFAYFLKTATNEGVRVLPYKTWLFYDHYWLNQTDTF